MKPKVMDRCDTKDRVKIRIGEPGSAARFWLNLTFEDSVQLEKFIEELNFELKKSKSELEYRKG